MKESIGVSTTYQDIFYGTLLYNKHTMKKLISQYHFSQSDVAKYRKKVIDFHNKHGIRATIDVFNVSKPTIYRWKKILVDSQGRLSSLIPTSTTLHNTRKETTHIKIITYIKNIREEHPHLGKEKIKPLLDKYCTSQGIVSIAMSTIGKVIKRHNLLAPPSVMEDIIIIQTAKEPVESPITRKR